MSGPGLIIGVDDSTGRQVSSSVRIYEPAATDPSTPAPSDGDIYYNTAINEWMFYDGTRTKWLSIASAHMQAGRNANTNAGLYYRSIDGMVLDAGNRGVAIPKGTLVSIAWSRTDSDAATLDVLANGAVIATLASSSSGAVRDDTVNADFAAGLMSFRNNGGGNQTSNVQIVAIYRRRV